MRTASSPAHLIAKTVGVLFAAGLAAVSAAAADSLPTWAGHAPNGDEVRIAVAPPANPRFQHLAWPKAVRTAQGTIVLGYLAGTHHGDESCPAVSVSTDDGKTFSPPNVLREFGLPQEALGWSLFSFNVGVELGQLAVVLVVASLLAFVRRKAPSAIPRVETIGSIAVIAGGGYWFVERVFFGGV